MIDQGLEILDEDVCMGLVSTEMVGRVGVSVSALPAIFPVNYRIVDGDVLFRTGEGVKSRAAFEGAIVGFEVDHVDPVQQSGWSVMLVGRARLLDADETRQLGEMDLSPWAGGDRSNLVRIHPAFVSGRRIVKECP